MTVKASFIDADFESKIIVNNLKKNVLSNFFLVEKLGVYSSTKTQEKIIEKGNNNYVFMYCVNGKATIKINNKKKQIQPNQFFIISKNAKYKLNLDDLCSIYYFYFTGTIALELYHKYKKTRYKNVPYSKERIKLFNKIIKLFNQKKQEYILEYTNILSLSFISAFVYEDFDFSDNILEEESLIDAIKKYLLNNVEKKLSLDDIAKKYNYSKSHLQAKFKKETGNSIVLYFNLQKIEKACQYLIHTKLSIKEISFKVGIEDPLYFSRLFKKTIGKSPRTYRKLSNFSSMRF